MHFLLKTMHMIIDPVRSHAMYIVWKLLAFSALNASNDNPEIGGNLSYRRKNVYVCAICQSCISSSDLVDLSHSKNR